MAILITTISSGLLIPSMAGATGGQVTSRSITMSSSAPSATSVTYTIVFTTSAGSPTTHPDVLITFCNAASDPIPGDTCNGTSGTDVPNIGTAASTGWTATTLDSGKTLKLTTASVNFAATTQETITVTGITNMSNTAGFYARLYDYAAGGSSVYVSPTNPGAYTDYGGFALSTAANILITSKVYETLVFCVFQTSCGIQANLSLGDASDSLNTTNAYVNSNAQFNISTNAQSGANVTMTGTTLCRSATPANCNTGTASVYTITGIGSTATAVATGTEQFGMCVDSNSLPSGFSVNATYLDSTAAKCHALGNSTYSGTAKFGFNDSTSSGGTNNASGSQVMSSTGPIASFTDTLAFVGDVASTTEAGIYSTSLNMVATGTF